MKKDNLANFVKKFNPFKKKPVDKLTIPIVVTDTNGKPFDVATADLTKDGFLIVVKEAK